MKKKVRRSCKIGDKVKVISGNQKGLSITSLEPQKISGYS
jgi:ribosomal protein L24